MATGALGHFRQRPEWLFGRLFRSVPVPGLGSWGLGGVVQQECAVVSDSRSPPDSSVHRILQARILEWVAISFSRDRTSVSGVSCIGRQILYH